MDTTSYDCIGSSFDDFLKDEGLYEECQAAAIKSVIAWELRHFMDEQKITKVEIAKRMGTSRSLVDKILDAKNTSITLATILKISKIIGKPATFSFGENEVQAGGQNCHA